jgi:hypothetical protein
MTETNTPAFPPAVAAAVVKVMASVKKLGKSDRNKFSGYDFVSVDSFLQALNPLCADAGLVILCDELEAEVMPGGEKPDGRGGTKRLGNQLRVKWAFTLIHESGEMSSPFRRSVSVPAEGAQAYGSAQSYALKQFMRGTFMVPTGDKDDADFHQAQSLTPVELVTPAQVVQLQDLADEVGADMAKLKKYIGVNVMTEIKAGDFDRVRELLERKRPAAEKGGAA